MEDTVKDQSPASERSSSKRERLYEAELNPSPAFKRSKFKISKARQLLANQVDVSLNLAKHLLLNKGKNVNLVLSPISIQVMLGLLAAGSSAQTLEQLLTFLKAKSVDDLNDLYSHIIAVVFAKSSDDLCLSFANGAWLDKSVSLKPPFKHVVDNLYKAASHQVDFKNKAEDAINLVNSWVDKETNGLIRKIVSPGSVNSSTKLVLANALYFKGKWSSKFLKSNTKPFDFHLLNGDLVKVPFMTSKKKQYIRAFDGFKVLRLPYEQGREDKRSFSMYIFLPDAKDGLSALVEKAGSESGFLEDHNPIWEIEVGQFRIPKFKFGYDIEVSGALKELGLVLPFNPNVGLSEMVDDPMPFYVTNIFHKSVIEVNEEGTEAAAATRLALATGCARGSKMKRVLIDFVADHPFLFVIKEETTGIVQFVGHVLDPSRA